jgi:hypothetical protein
MSDSALENAMARRDILASEISSREAEIKEKRSEIERLNKWIKTWHDLSGIPAPDPVANVPDTAFAPWQRNPKKEQVARMAVRILKETGKPMPRHELYEALKARGVTLLGSDPEMVLSTMLWRMRKVITRLPKLGYWPIEEPYPEGSYHPGVAGDELEDLLR